jgi:hypothetical protein
MGDACRLELVDIGLWDDAAAEHDDVGSVKGSKLLDNLRKERQVSARQSGQAHTVDVLLNRDNSYLLGGLVEAGVDDFASGVT